MKLPRTSLLVTLLHLVSAPAAAQMAPMMESPELSDDGGGILPIIARWRPEDLPLKVYLIGLPPDEISLQDALSSAERAVHAWDSVACIAPPLAWMGHLDSLDALPAGAIPIYFVAPSQDGCFWEPWTNLAITINDCDEGAPLSVLVNTRDWRWAPDPDFAQLLDDAYTGPRTVSLTATLTHELGHVLGLSHALDTPLATMAPRYLSDGGMASLSALDRAAICAMFAPQGQQDGCDADAACAASLDDAGARCVSALAGIRACEEDRAQTGEYCAQNLLICEDVCYLSSPSTGTGFCTQSCADDAGCPDGYGCEQVGDPAQSVCMPTPRVPAAQGCTSAAASPPSPSWLLLLAPGTLWRRRRALRA